MDAALVHLSLVSFLFVCSLLTAAALQPRTQQQTPHLSSLFTSLSSVFTRFFFFCLTVLRFTFASRWCGVAYQPDCLLDLSRLHSHRAKKKRMSGTAPRRTRAPSPPFDGSDSDYSGNRSSYSYDSSATSSSRSPSYSSYSDSSASSGVSGPPRHGRRRFRSESPVLQRVESVPAKPRMEGVLGDGDGTVGFVSNHVLPSVLGGGGGAVLHESAGEMSMHDESGVLPPSDKPVGDWACGVCSNINSEQRDACYRCGCHFTESLLATPSYEVCVTRLPPDVPASAVERAIRRTAPDGCSLFTATDAVRGLVYAQFASVEEATKYVVSRRCEVEVVGNGSGGNTVRLRLSFALQPHPRPPEEDVAAETARATEAAERESRESALTAAGVPRFLWSHTWNPPASFPSVEKRRAFLSTMSTHWDHLSEEQKRYYEGEVKKALKQAVSPLEVAGSSAEGAVNNNEVGSATTVRTIADETPSSAAPPAMANESPQKSTSKTSHALDGLKRRLAERKSALKKGEAGGNSSSSSTSSAAATPQSVSVSGSSAGTTSAVVAAAISKVSGNAAGATSPGVCGGFPATPPGAVAMQMQAWGGFPVPPQYRTLADVPRSVELARVPMNVCERLLPPALLQVVRTQFR
jgi:hypothetical protein